MSPIQRKLRQWKEEEIEDDRAEIERLNREKTWQSGNPIETSGELSQEIARLLGEISKLERELKEMK